MRVDAGRRHHRQQQQRRQEGQEGRQAEGAALHHPVLSVGLLERAADLTAAVAAAFQNCLLLPLPLFVLRVWRGEVWLHPFQRVHAVGECV